MNSERHKTQYKVTVRLTFLTQSFCMKPTLQGLTWFECCEMGKDGLLRRFMFQLTFWSTFCAIYHEPMGANLLHVLMTCDKRSSEHFVTWRLHCTATFV